MMTLNERRAQLYKRYEEEQEFISLNPPLAIEQINERLELFLYSDRYIWKDVLSNSGYVIGFLLLSNGSDPNNPGMDIVAEYIEPHYRGRGFMRRLKESIDI